MKAKTHKCKPCEEQHVADISIWPVTEFTYRLIDGQVYISAPSVFRMFYRMDLEKMGLRFIKVVNEIYFKKE